MSISEEQMQEMLKNMGGTPSTGNESNTDGGNVPSDDADEEWDDGIGDITIQNATVAMKLSYMLYHGGKGDDAQRAKTGRKAVELLLGIAESQYSKRPNAGKVNDVMREALNELLEQEYSPEVRKEIADMLKEPENLKALTAYKDFTPEDLERISEITKAFGESTAENRGEALQSFLDDMQRATVARSANADRSGTWLARMMDGRVDNAGTLRASLKAHLDILNEDFTKEQLREGSDGIAHTMTGMSSAALAMILPPPMNLVAYAITGMSLLNNSPDMKGDAYENGCFLIGSLLGKATDKFKEGAKTVADEYLKYQKENDKTKVTETIESHERNIDRIWKERGTPRMLEELNNKGLLNLSGSNRMSDRALAALQRGYAESYYSKKELSEASRNLQKMTRAPKTEARSDIMRVLGRAKPENKEKDKAENDKPKVPEVPDKSHADKEKDKKEPKKTAGRTLG